MDYICYKRKTKESRSGLLCIMADMMDAAMAAIRHMVVMAVAEVAAILQEVVALR